MPAPHRQTIIPAPNGTERTDEFPDRTPEREDTWTDEEGGDSPGELVVGPSQPGALTVLPRVDEGNTGPRLLVTRERRYEIARPLGAGGSGEVFLAEDRDIGRRVAIKRVGMAARSERALMRFVREVQTIGRLEHPNIVPIHDVGQDEAGQYYFVMKYVEGITLANLLEKLRAGDSGVHIRFGLEQRVQLMRGLMEAVAFAHTKGVIHRDLKPENVMIGPYGEVLVLDWGIASTEAQAAAERVLIGTPRYMSPEQANREPVDRRSDVYSLCVMMHELLTLRHYLDDLDEVDDVLGGVRSRRVPLASTVLHPHQDPVPMDLSWLIDKGTHKDPAERYGSVDEILDALRDRSEGNIHVQCPVTFTKRAGHEVEKAMDRHVVPRMGRLLSAGRLGLAAAAAFMIVMVGAVLAAGVAAIAVATVILMSL